MSKPSPILGIPASLPKRLSKAIAAYDAKFPGRIAEVDDEREFVGPNRDVPRYSDSSAAFWIYTRAGWCVDPACHTGTGYDVDDALAVLKRIAPCDCRQCREELGLIPYRSDGGAS